MNTIETDRAPDGYVECERGCGRWTPVIHGASFGKVCYTCLGAHTCAHLDWMPPLPVPAKAAPKVVQPREAGQRWLCAWGGEAVEASIIGGLSELGTWPMDNGDWWDDSRWTGKGSIGSVCAMTLLSPAPVAKSAETLQDELKRKDLEGHWTQVKAPIHQCNWGLSATGGTRHCIGDRGHDGAHGGHIQPAKPPVAQASFTGACGISMSSTDGRDISDLIKWHGDGCRECAPVAQGAKCCEQCWKVDASVSPSSFDGRSMLWCTMCHFQAMEWSRRQSNDPVDFGVSLLHNPAIPERLTKAQLASDYYDDCLPEAGR